MQWVTLLSNISRVSSSTLVPRVIVWIFSCSPCVCVGFIMVFWLPSIKMSVEGGLATVNYP